MIRDGGDHSLQSFPSPRALLRSRGSARSHESYEEEGEYSPAGAVAGQAPSRSKPHGGAQVRLERGFSSSGPRPPMLAEARKFADGLDPAFLWQCRKAAEFGFQDLARDYVGHDPATVESAGVLLKLHSAPMYFYRRGRGRFQAAPEDTLKLALAGVEKKKRLQEKIAMWAVQLARFECPPEIASLRDELLYAPDRAKPETKAWKTGLRATRVTRRAFRALRLIGDSNGKLGRCVHEVYPRARFSGAAEQVMPTTCACESAASGDDVGNTEIDDAFSVRRVGRRNAYSDPH